jgi:hypothetical protein
VRAEDEDIVGFSCFGLLIPAIVVMISGSRSSLTSSRQRSLWRTWRLSLISVALIVFGLVNFQFIHNSPRTVVEGNLWNIRQLFRSSTFMISDTTGHAVLTRCTYTGPGLVQGERARVRYVAYNRKLVDMDMLTGSYQAWHLQESSGKEDYQAWVAIGLLCGFFAYRQRAKISQGQTTGALTAARKCE